MYVLRYLSLFPAASEIALVKYAPVMFHLYLPRLYRASISGGESQPGERETSL